MIAKTVVGSSFEGALSYGAGQRPGRKSAEAELLGSSNLREGTPQIMAKQMEEVANESARIQKPVWHTSLSWPPGETITTEQKVAAAEMYCELMEAPFERHQVAIYEHHDKPHEHIHIYINRVPIDGGPALRTSNNFYRQPKVCQEICEKLGMQQLPDRQERDLVKARKAVADVDPTKQARRGEVRVALDEILAQPSIAGQNINWLTRELQKRAIGVKYTHDTKGTLRGVSFTKDGLAMTGQEAGYKAARLAAAFEAAATQQQRQGVSPSKDVQQVPATAPLPAPDAAPTPAPTTAAPTLTPTAPSAPAAAPMPTEAPTTTLPAAAPTPAVVPPTIKPADDEPTQTPRLVPRRRK
jgi:hypothetical protein